MKKQFLTQAVLASTLFIAPFCFANTTIGPGTTAGTVNTAGTNQNTLEVLPTGQILGNNTTAVFVNSSNATVLVDPNNTFVGVNAIQTTGGSGNAHGVDINSSNANIIIGPSSGINAADTGGGSNGIFVNAQNAVISNRGFLQGNNSAIFINDTNTTINNFPGGFIQPSIGGGNNPTILYNGNGLTLNNAGNILANLNGQVTIQINNDFNTINNNAGGLIQNTTGSFALNITGGNTGNIINNEGATIASTGNGDAIGMFMNNQNTILANSGLIHAESARAITMGSFTTFPTILNIGTIENNFAGGPTILDFGNSTTSLFNLGNITNAAPGGNAIFWQNGGSNITLIQAAGTITGNVYLADRSFSGDDNMFFMEGGTIIGDVFSPSNRNSVLQLNGGTIAGDVVNTCGCVGTINLAGTNVLGQIRGNGGQTELNVTGGSFGSFQGSGNAFLNVNGTFTANGYIDNLRDVTIQNAGTVFTLNAPITNMNGSGLFINPGTTMILNANITSGANQIENNGLFVVNGAQIIDTFTNALFSNNNGATLRLGSTGALELSTAQFQSYQGADLNIQIAGIGVPGGTANSGRLIIISRGNGDEAILNGGSTITPQLTGGFVPHGTQFNIVKTMVPNSTILDQSSLVQTSAVVRFNKILQDGNKALELTAFRNPYLSFSSSDVTFGIASALDTLAQGNGPNNANLLALLGQLDMLRTGQAVEDSMESLTPPFNNGLTQGSFLGMNMLFEGVQGRIEDQHGMIARSKGVSMGDVAGDTGAWVRVLGASLNQQERDNVDGYKANAGGIAVGADWGVNDCTTFGFAASYTKVDVDDKNLYPKDIDIESWQGSAYAWLEFTKRIYLDAIFAAASNNYDVNRIISVNQINTAAQSSFDGTQWGLQAELGWRNIIVDSAYDFAPFIRFKMIHLELDDYTETGANFLNLSVQNDDIDEIQGGIGIRFATSFKSNCILYIPVLTAVLAYDFENDGEQTVANFVNGPAFSTDGVKPSPAVFDLGLALNAHISPHSIVTAKYNLELRNDFVGNEGYLQYFYQWG